MALTLFDRNKNNKLDPDERAALTALLDALLPRQ
jgi:hypothetical protein